MKALLVVLALAGTAHATPMVKPPAGWTGGADAELVRQTGMVGHFGGVHGVIEAERYDAPKPGAVLYVTRIAANVAAADAAARAELDNLHPSKQATTDVETHYDEHADTARKQLEATTADRDSTSKIATASRIVIAATTDRLVAVRGDCMSAADTDPALFDACKAALATLDPAIDANDRVALVLAPPVKEPIAGSAAAEPPPPNAITGSRSPSLTDGSHIPLPPMTIPQDRPPSDRRPVFAGLGIAILAAMFWWNSRRRARFEREDADKEPDDR